jgi:hypothetical protein
MGLGSSGFGLNRVIAPSKKPFEPFLYDPAKAAKTVNKERTYAAPGSLLRVWEGSLEIAKDNIIKV